MADVPIKPELIKWARENRGLGIAEAAAQTGISFEDWTALEGGTLKANKKIYKSIRDKLLVPGSVLFRQTAPEITTLPEDFRTIEGREATLSLQTRFAVDFARTAVAQFNALLEDGVVSPLPRLPRLHMELDAADQGEAERRRLGVSALRQIGWEADQLLRNWRTIIESAGCFVFYQKFPVNDCKGFALYDNPNAPVIILNKDEPTDVGKVYTLIHEYAHLLIRAPGFSNQNESNNVENYCNRFAEGFLMPKSMIRELLGSFPEKAVHWEPEIIIRLARKIGVSQQALALRFENIGIAQRGYFDWFREQQPKIDRRKASGTGGNHNYTQLSELGYGFTGLVLRAERNKSIPDFEAYELLNIAPKYFDEISNIIELQSARVSA